MSEINKDGLNLLNKKSYFNITSDNSECSKCDKESLVKINIGEENFHLCIDCAEELKNRLSTISSLNSNLEEDSKFTFEI